ncbi:MAG TPA: hypothetical protein VKJ67_10315 [Methylomirabilota bacterium]|nr:hypothetical protein [Methylomirabilota bacterium]
MRAFWVAALAMGLVVLLRLAAHACPADPSWIAGLSDDSVDDVIQHVLTGSADAPAVPAVDTRPPRFLRLAAIDAADGPVAAARATLPTRAPPVRLALSI